MMDAHVADHGRAVRLERVDEGAPTLGTPQTRLPRKGDGMERRRDPVGQKLRLSVTKGERGGKADAGSWLKLPFEGVAMDVDDAGQREKSACIEDPPAGAAAEPQRPVAVEQEGCVGQGAVGQ